VVTRLKINLGFILRIQKTVILRVVFYGYKTSLILRVESKVKVSEKRS
jgi:hypothetical protein